MILPSNYVANMDKMGMKRIAQEIFTNQEISVNIT